ncbi:MAG: hypothetical protein M5U09_15675 [Gammaproteobacteria bacterium]|nr:hypothetical protein [Gammaproteobacteria bacterium]
MLFDITRQKATENELRLSRERFRDFADIASDFYWEVDAAMNLTFSSSHGPVLGRIPMAELISTRGGAVDGGRILVDAASAGIPRPARRARAVRVRGVVHSRRLDRDPHSHQGHTAPRR